MIAYVPAALSRLPPSNTLEEINMSELQHRGESNEQIVSRFVEECFDDNYRELVDEYIADDFVGHEPSLPEPFRGREGFKEILESYRSGFSDITSEVTDIATEGDTVAVRWIFRGKHEGPVMGIEPTGNEIEMDGMEFNRLEDGKIVETRLMPDTLGMLKQLDALPEEFAA